MKLSAHLFKTFHAFLRVRYQKVELKIAFFSFLSPNQEGRDDAGSSSQLSNVRMTHSETETAFSFNEKELLLNL